MKKPNIYTIITTIAMITMPAAAAINFGDAAYDALLIRVSRAWIATAGGIATGAGFEAIGILAGHLAVTFYSRKDGRYKAAVVALVAYVLIGWYELRAIEMARFVPVLAGLVYLLAGLQYEAVEEKEEETAVNAAKLDFQLEQARLDRETDRRIKLEKQQAANAAKLAKIQQPASYQRQHKRQDAGMLPSDWRQLSDQQRHDLAHATREKRDEIMPDMAGRTRRIWHERLDKIAAQNGGYLQDKLS